MAITGTFPELTQARAAGAQASHVVLPTHAPGGPFLSASERDTLWELFEVPAYVWMLDREGRLIAYECEAYSGLHLANEKEAPAMGGSIDSSPCDCGRPGPRVILA
jgi:hypothetical protein